MENLKEVSQDEFYDHLEQQDATSNVICESPYTIEYALNNGEVIAKVEHFLSDVESEEYLGSKYYLTTKTIV